MFAGDFSNSLADEDRFKTATAFRAMEAMGFGAATFGEKDFYHGVSFARQIVKRHPGLLVSANITDAKTGQLLAAPFVVRTFPDPHGAPGSGSKLRVAITGVLGADLYALAGPQIGDTATQLSVTDPAAALKALLPRLHRLADVVVVLAHIGQPAAVELAQTVPGIDLLVVGHFPHADITDAPPIRSTYVVANGDEARFGGQAIFTLREGKIQSVRSRTIPLSATFPDNPQLAALRDSYKSELSKMAGGVITAKEATPVASLFPVVLANGYVGSQACASCHAAAFKVFKKTAHAHALQTLEITKKGVNAKRPDCVRCHTVGFGQATGFRIAAPNRALADVGCESCHGPGRIHVNLEKGGQHMPGTIVRIAPEGSKALCVRCHDAENDPLFAFGSDVEKIRHWGAGFLAGSG